MNMDRKRDPERMQCMEVWGGNVRVERHFQMRGLEAWISSQPEGQAAAGGDVYYLSSCASGRITRLLLADVSGHGELVARTAAGLRDLMRRNINVVSQRRFVAAMNRQFSAASGDSDFATAVVSSFYAPTRVLSLCNAGHPHPLIFRAAQRQWTTLRVSNVPGDSAHGATNLPLGVDDQTGYRQLSVRLDKGDKVLCYTDAFTDARGSDGKALGVEGMLQIVASIQRGYTGHGRASLHCGGVRGRQGVASRQSDARRRHDRTLSRQWYSDLDPQRPAGAAAIPGRRFGQLTDRHGKTV